MKKRGVLNKDISEVIASMGHMDLLTICDAGLPIPEKVHRIDLAVRPGLPGFVEVTEAVVDDLQVQEILLAEELRDQNPQLIQLIQKVLKDIPISYIPHELFKEKSGMSRAIIRTGECTPYANIILVSGVIF